MFVDQVKIYVKAGDGGNGCVSFRREKYVPRGGPNGGDGGDGGDVVMTATARLSTLLDLKYQQHYIGMRAPHGQGKNKRGRNSPNTVIPVPLGTIIRDAESQEILGDLVEEGQTLVVAKGGKGGRGNARFATPTRQAPTFAEEGGKGEAHWLMVELKLLADVGLVGPPNAGKSTLLSRVSSARPKIGDYPFTTLAPHLGMVRSGEDIHFVLADLPGLIEGAHEGRGLGDRFLRHIERTRVLAYLLDISEAFEGDPVDAFEVIRHEMGAYHSMLISKPFAVVGTKRDIQGEGRRLRRLSDYCSRNGYPFFAISAVTGEGIPALVAFLGAQVEACRRSEACAKS